MPQSDSQAPSEAPVYAVHVRFETHPERKRLVAWAEPPLGLGRHHGGYEVIGQTADLNGLVRWVLSFGTGVEVVGPETLRRRVARKARRIAALHSADTPSDEALG